jgi:hypothetical protein
MTPACKFSSLLMIGALTATSSALAQESPRPQDLEPGVNTSAPAQSPAAVPARETPRPQDLEPGVNTSSAAQSPDAPPPALPGATPTTGARAPGANAPPAGGNPSDATPGAQGQAARPAARGGRGQDRLELDATQITGNRELPKVLYIVPWKRSDLGDLVGKPVNSLLDEVLTPVDRDVFKRENRYYRALTPGAAENDRLSAPDPGPTGPIFKPVPTNSEPAAGMPGSSKAPPRSVAPGPTGAGSAGTASPPPEK